MDHIREPEERPTDVYVPLEDLKFPHSTNRLQIFQSDNKLQKLRNYYYALRIFNLFPAYKMCMAFVYKSLLGGFIWMLPTALFWAWGNNIQGHSNALITAIDLKGDGVTVVIKTLDNKTRDLNVRQLRKPTAQEFGMFSSNSQQIANQILSKYVPIIMLNKEGKPLRHFFLPKINLIEQHNDLVKAVVTGCEVQTEEYQQNQMYNQPSHEYQEVKIENVDSKSDNQKK
eukprot:403347787